MRIKAQRFLSLAFLVVTSPVLAQPAPAPTGDGSPEVAIIVNLENDWPDPSLEELRAVLTLRRQFWKDGRRVVLLLPASSSLERRVLLSRVYRSTDLDLRKEWARRLFSGEIPAVPSSVPHSDAAGAAVRRSRGAISAVPADAIPPGVRVLAISGLRPGEPGYPLGAETSP